MVRDDFPTMFYHDVPEEEAKVWLSKYRETDHFSIPNCSYSHWNFILALANSRLARLRPHALSTFCDKARSAAWKKIPSSYLVCEDDQAIPVQAQDGMIARAKELGGEIETERLFVSHSPYIVKPEHVARFLRRSAGENLPEEG